MDSNWIATADPVRLPLNGWLFAVALMLVSWLVECFKEDAGVVDLGWTLGVGLLAVYYATSADGYAPRRILVATMASLWSFRLALYILIDRICKEREDTRYRDLRAYWGGGRRAHLCFLPFFEAQSLLVVLFSQPMLVLVWNTRSSISACESAGVLVWVASVVGESVADRQLARFRADPATAGRVCGIGLWRYSLHPNYFFEWLHWWAYVLMGVGAPYGWLTLVGPAAMWLFLQKLTGIPATENHALKSRGEEYRAYQRSTSRFVPWFPKRA
jgi:steroid 5-alpha reductase family enzyme